MRDIVICWIYLMYKIWMEIGNFNMATPGMHPGFTLFLYLV